VLGREVGRQEGRKEGWKEGRKKERKTLTGSQLAQRNTCPEICVLFELVKMKENEHFLKAVGEQQCKRLELSSETVGGNVDS
jgi:predicted transposase YdaD